MLGEREPTVQISPLVMKYRELAKIVEQCESYPRSIDQRMNKLYDAAVVLAA
jgi:hypothetical protein